MKVMNVREDRTPNNTLCIFDVYMPKIGLTIRDCRLIEGTTGEFVTMPSRYNLVEDKKEFYNVVQWDRDRMAAWSKIVKPLVREELKCS